MKIFTLFSAATVLLSAIPGVLSIELRGAAAATKKCPEGKTMIKGVCRDNPEGPRPTCADGRPARRMCFRPNSSWYQCEQDCYLGPPGSNARRQRRSGNPPAEETYGINVHTDTQDVADEETSDDECPEGESMINGVCRGEPKGPRPICSNGRPAIRACYRPNSSWWQCEQDCYLGPPGSNARRQRRSGNPPAEETYGITVHTDTQDAADEEASDDECPEGETMIKGVCRDDPEGPRPTCSDGRPARRACYRPNSSWWQCEQDCYLGPPGSNARRQRRSRKPPAEETQAVGLNIA